MSRLGRISRHDSPETVRDLLLAYYRMLDACDDVGPESGIRGLIAHRAVRADIVQAIDKARAHLSRSARQGGQGVRAGKAVQS